MKTIFALVLGLLLTVGGFQADALTWTTHDQDHVSNPNGGPPCCRDITTTTYYHNDAMGNMIIDGWTTTFSVDCGGGYSLPSTYTGNVVFNGDLSAILSVSLTLSSGMPIDLATGTAEIEQLNLEHFNRHWNNRPTP